VASAVDDDRRAGLLPVAIAAVAGSTNTGSVDDVPALAELARREDLWLHVDAAYGGAARLSERDRGRVPGLELADSVTLDPHKWFFQAYDIGGLLVRDGGWLAEVFADRPEYYRTGSVPPAESEGETTWPREAHSLDFYRLGLEGTRRFRALKLWLSWRHLGTPGLGRLVERNDDLAAALAERIAASDDFEACPPRPELSVVCFRHLPWWWRDRGPTGSTGREELDALDAHQDALQAALERDGSGWLSTTRLRGATWLRAGILNYMSSEADIEALLASLRELAGSR
jgi:glutamate/tyrosine decarboxylase-like PLP-dependent enzyme